MNELVLEKDEHRNEKEAFRMRADALCEKCRKRDDCDDLDTVLSFCKDYDEDESLFW